MMRKKNSNTLNNRVGQFNKNKYGSIMEVIEYNNANDILVKFIESEGKPIRTTWLVFCNGKVKNAYDKSVYGVGYIGDGTFKVSENGKHTFHYMTWSSMFQRCYSEKRLENNPTYVECKVCDEWHNFQNFAKWYDENYYEIDGDKMQLDKDILVKGNKIYSPNTCIFVPKNINILFTKRDTDRGLFPLGVSFDANINKYKAQCCDGKGKQIRLGNHITPEEAFSSYKKYKEQLIKSTAEEYKDNIPTKLYNAMLKCKIQIND